MPWKPAFSPTETRNSYNTAAATSAFSMQPTIVRESQPKSVSIAIDGRTESFSAKLLRDACNCPQCVHPSTNQRLFSTADIPNFIEARTVETDDSGHIVTIRWENDVPDFDGHHITSFEISALRELSQTGSLPITRKDTFQDPVLWTQQRLDLQDFDYKEYMTDDRALYQLMDQLQKHGLAFVTNIPGSKECLATIATRMGPIKDTFYGKTWDGEYLTSAIFSVTVLMIPSANCPGRDQRSVHVAGPRLSYRLVVLPTTSSCSATSLYPVCFGWWSECFRRCIPGRNRPVSCRPRRI